ncbi:hypothetical protein EV359DRAFT_68474 [Lentinula novae-zelandiae]|nr:hypothetical protein EV359DRAFT_68474 [Lentinula novae-zelandiae]
MHQFLPHNLAKLLDTQIQAVVVCVDLRGQYKYTAEDKIQETLENLSQLERKDKRVLVVRSMDLVEGMDDEEFWSYVEAAIAEKNFRTSATIHALDLVPPCQSAPLYTGKGPHSEVLTLLARSYLIQGLEESLIFGLLKNQKAELEVWKYGQTAQV